MESKIRTRVTSADKDCRRMSLSGSSPGWAGDLMMAGRSFQVKARVRKFSHLYDCLEGRFGLVLSADRSEPLLVMRLGDFLRSCRFREVPDCTGSKMPIRDCGTGWDQGPRAEGRKEAHDDG